MNIGLIQPTCLLAWESWAYQFCIQHLIWALSVSGCAKDNCPSFSTLDTTQLPDAASDLAAILSGFGTS